MFDQFTVLSEVPGEPDWVPIFGAPENIEFEGTAIELARSLVAGDPARGGQWRVRVWEGRDADISVPPAVEHYAR